MQETNLRTRVNRIIEYYIFFNPEKLSIDAVKVWYSMECVVAYLTMLCGEVAMIARGLTFPSLLNVSDSL